MSDLKTTLAYNDTLNCVKCGYCLPACPTYQTTGRETHSPRGRINLVKMAAEGKLTNWDLLGDAMDQCLGCRACQTACPVDVDYGKIFESSKIHLLQQRKEHPYVKKIKTFFFRKLLPNRRALSLMGTGIWLYQKIGLQKLTRSSGILRLLPQQMKEFEAILPVVTNPQERTNRQTHYKPTSTPVAKVIFMTGCIMDVMFERINRLSMELLQRAGCEVFTLKEETCCGALQAHAGDVEVSRDLAKRNIEAFETLLAQESIDYIVNNAGGCGAMMKEYTHLFVDNPMWKARAQAFEDRVRDISQVLIALDFDQNIPCENQHEMIVTYQPSCHMTNVQKVRSEPIKLIRSIHGVSLREMKQADQCCGSAGIYNLVQYKSAMEILDAKMKTVKETAAHTIVTTNPGCLLQMQVGIRREGLQEKVRAVHLVELLAEACDIH